MAPQRRTHRRYRAFKTQRKHAVDSSTQHTTSFLIDWPGRSDKANSYTSRAAWHLSADWARFECTTHGGLWLDRPSDGAYRYETRTSAKIRPGHGSALRGPNNIHRSFIVVFESILVWVFYTTFAIYHSCLFSFSFQIPFSFSFTEINHSSITRSFSFLST